MADLDGNSINFNSISAQIHWQNLPFDLKFERFFFFIISVCRAIGKKFIMTGHNLRDSFKCNYIMCIGRRVLVDY